MENKNIYNGIMIKEFIEKGNIKLDTDRVCPFEQIVETNKYIGKGHKYAGVTIMVEHSNKNTL